jgi:hypothetical protein
MATRTTSSAERRLDVVVLVPETAHGLVGEDHRRVVERLPEHAVRRAAIAEDRHQAAEQHMVDNGDPLHRCGTY